MQHFLTELLIRHPALRPVEDAMRRAVGLVVDTFEADHTLFVCGNGGSGADADHIAGEFLKGFMLKRPMDAAAAASFEKHFGADGAELGKKLQRGLRCVSLLSHPGFITAFCNDVDPELIYAQQLYALGRPGDTVLGISTSGNAANIRRAFQVARERGIRTMLLTGANEAGRCREYADLVVGVPEMETYKIQELHLPFYHFLCMAVEAHFFGDK